MNNFFTSLMTRWTSESPTLFKNITKIGLTLIAVGTSLLALNQIPSFTVPFELAKYSSYLILAGTCMSGVSKLTSTTNS